MKVYAIKAKSVQDWAHEAEQPHNQGKFFEDVHAYNGAIEADPTIAEVYLNKAVALVRALDHDCRCHRVPEPCNGAFQSGSHLQRLSTVSKGLAVLRKRFETGPPNQERWFGYAPVLNEMDDFAGALAAANKSIELPQAMSMSVHVPLHNERAHSLLKLNRTAEAIQDLDRVARFKPIENLDRHTRELFAMVLSTTAIELTNNEKHVDALPHYRRAAQADPTFQNHHNHGICLMKNNKEDEALAELYKAKFLDENQWKAHAVIGTICMRIHQYANAAEAFGKAADFRETCEDETINFNWGTALMNLGRTQDAKDPPLQRATKANRNNWTAQAMLGTIYIGEQQFAMARRVLAIAANLPGGSSDSSVAYNMGYAQLHDGDSEAALGNFRKASRLDPNNESASSR